MFGIIFCLSFFGIIIWLIYTRVRNYFIIYNYNKNFSFSREIKKRKNNCRKYYRTFENYKKYNKYVPTLETLNEIGEDTSFDSI